MRIHQFTIIIFLLLVLGLAGFKMVDKGKKPKTNGIQWLTLEEAAARNKKEPRKIFIDVYTDWCGWCKKMDKSTFSDPEIAQYVNKYFYAVKLNAEDRKPINVNGKIYNYNSKMRTHEAALALLNGKMGYPTTVYLDENMAILSPVPGYLDVTAFRNVITYYGENHYKKKSFAEFTSGVASK